MNNEKDERNDMNPTQLPTSYRGLPFWAWNTVLDSDKIRSQVDDFAEMGFGGFVIHSRNGLGSNAFTDMGLKLQWELVTKRCVVFKDTDCEVVLDKNEYLGHTDYELEVEYTQEHENDAQAILNIFRDMLTRRKCFLAYKEVLRIHPTFQASRADFSRE